MKTLNSIKETFAYGKKLAAKLNGGDILLLSGDLGAGKTSLVKGIAAGLGIKQEITSPTFTLMNVYQTSRKLSALSQLVHIDTYRLKDEKELIEIGVEDYLGKPDTVCVVEWPEKIARLLKRRVSMDVTLHDFVKSNKNITSLNLEHGENANQRKISVS